MPDSADLVVIGGGISGLSLASFCAEQGRKVVVLERSDRVGGCVRTHRLSDGFWLELGAHTAYNSYGNVIGALERRGGMDALLPRAKVRFRVLDPYKRPVSATADSHEVRDVVEVTIRESRERTVRLLFDPEHNLEERILSEQFEA